MPARLLDPGPGRPLRAAVCVMVLVGLAAAALAIPASAAGTEVRRAYFHANEDHDPNPWFSFDPDDPDAALEAYQDTYIAVPSTGTVWFEIFDISPELDEPLELAPDATIDGTLVFCSEVLLYYDVLVEVGFNRVQGGDRVSGIGPGTGCAEVPFSIEPGNRTLPADERIWFNIDPLSTTVSGLLTMTLSKHAQPSWVDFPLVIPEDPAADDDGGGDAGDGTSGSDADDGSGDEGDGGGADGGEGNDTGTDASDGGDDATPAGGDADGGPATPGFGAGTLVVALAAAALLVLGAPGRRR